MTVCADCLKAETRMWSVYSMGNGCCLARLVMEAVPKSGAGLTLEQVRRRLCAAIRDEAPELWPEVRARLDVLLEREGATA